LKDFTSIIVKSRHRKKVKIVSKPCNYKLIGKGAQGAVFKLSDDRCVKIYPHAADKLSEEKVLKAAQGSPVFPKVYEFGENYIVMEYIQGKDLKKYLKKKKELPDWVCANLLLFLQEYRKLQLSRQDARLRHIIVCEKEKSIKVIDHVNTNRVVKQHPLHLLNGLKRLGFCKSFLKYVKQTDKKLYKEWKHLCD
jgi:predicted Ser/Thr protein kinase